MLRTKDSQDQSGRDLLVLVECKHNSPAAQTSSLDFETVNKKFKTLMKLPDEKEKFMRCSNGMFHLNNFQIPLTDVVYVLLSSHQRVPQIDRVNLCGFPGQVCFMDHASLQEMIGAPLSNCGAVLIESKAISATEGFPVRSIP